jgi:hypothetical protein
VSFLPKKSAPYLPGKQIVADWRRQKLETQVSETVARVEEAEEKLRIIEGDGGPKR